MAIKSDGKIKVDPASASGGTATIPKASTSVLGGVKVDNTTIKIDANGTISASATGGTGTVKSVNSNSPDANGNVTITIPSKASDISAESALGNPTVDGQVLSSTTTGARSWVTTATGTVKSVNSTTPDANGNVAITIPAAYTLPTATTGLLGGVKIDGTSITINNGVISSSATTLDGLTDVTITDVANGELLVKTSGGWANQTTAEAGLLTTMLRPSVMIGDGNNDEQIITTEQDADGFWIYNVQAIDNNRILNARQSIRFVLGDNLPDGSNIKIINSTNAPQRIDTSSKIIKAINNRGFNPGIYVYDIPSSGDPRDETQIIDIQQIAPWKWALSYAYLLDNLDGTDDSLIRESLGLASHWVTNHVPSGFLDHTTSSLSLTENVNAVNNDFSVTITGSNFPVFINGKLKLKSTETYTVTGASTQRYYIYYSKDGVLSASASSWNMEPGGFDGKAFVATVYWDSVNHRGILEEERHHSWRDIHWHHWAHHTVGARYSSAHTANGINISNPNNDNYATATVSSGEIYDEDIANEISTSTIFNIFYWNGANMVFDRGTATPYKLISGVPQYNNPSTGTLANKTASNTTGYFVSWVYATNAIGANGDSQIAIILGQDTDANMTLTEAQNAALPVTPSNFIVEWKLVWKMIYRYGAGNIITHISNTDYRTASSLPSGQIPTSNIAASAVSFAKSDGTTSNVQSVMDSIPLSDVEDIASKWTPATAGTGTQLALAEPTGDGNSTVTIKAPAINSSYTLTLPTGTGTTNQVLTTNGSGELSWSNPSSSGTSDEMSTNTWFFA